jgi:hypothetical protein
MGRLSLLFLAVLVAGCAHARKLQQDPEPTAEPVSLSSALSIFSSPFQAFKDIQASRFITAQELERRPPAQG